MGQFLHDRRDTQGSLDSTRGLRFEECGALEAMLDLIYLHEGAVEVDEAYIIRSLAPL